MWDAGVTGGGLTCCAPTRAPEHLFKKPKIRLPRGLIRSEEKVSVNIRRVFVYLFLKWLDFPKLPHLELFRNTRDAKNRQENEDNWKGQRGRPGCVTPLTGPSLPGQSRISEGLLP